MALLLARIKYLPIIVLLKIPFNDFVSPLLISYLKYRLKAGDEHSVHSPFVFKLYTEVIRSKEVYYAFNEIEALRQELLQSDEVIRVLDLGAGSRKQKGNERKVRDIARHAEKSARFGQLLFRLVHFFKPATIFDLGTSLGITTLYLAAAAKKSRIYTFEGCPETARIARKQFDRLSFPHIRLVEGNLDHTLAATLEQASIRAIDFAFFDANHRYQPTVQYFETLLARAHEGSVFVFDDIHWSAEMEQAWQYIRNHPRVLLTIDLFYVGLVFFRTHQPKQHFVLKF
jgi:predicted O-methyltransferase YrrM